MVYLFAATIFLSALLLFWIQLTMAKMLLPRLGGTPAVWNTCMLFFQILRLAGYSYALVTTSWLEARKQAVLHSVLLLLSSLYLPLTLAGDAAAHPYPSAVLVGCQLNAAVLPIF